MEHFMKLVTVTVVLATVVWPGECKRYCLQDEDCKDLGELKCIYSACRWGVCGCPRDKAAKFLGSRAGFGCVPLKRVGEECSNAWREGVCAATDSYCDEETKRCTCEPLKVPVWGGEKCASRQSTSAGDTCSGSLGTCQLDSSLCESPTANGYWYGVVQYSVPTCACRNSERLVLNNFYVQRSGIGDFPGSKYPVCQNARIGDICLKDEDCPTTGSHCGSNNRCQCDEEKVKDYWGYACKKPMSIASDCKHNSNEYHCDGTKGLICGDMCNVSFNSATDTEECTCGPAHTTSGSICVPILEGGLCNGDMNCKGISDTAYCEDKKCKEGN